MCIRDRIYAVIGERTATTAEDGRPKVITTIFPPYDFARAVGGLSLIHI